MLNPAATPPMLLLLLVSLSAGARAQQDPGMGYPLQLFRIAPSATALLHEPRLEAQRSTPAPGATEDHADDEVGGFQAWDGAGRTAFGFLYPDQTRVEVRDAGGSVAGAYSYLDKDGDAVKVQYWDSGSGFHAATNRLPAAALGLPLPPNDTPEVQAARDQHLQQVQAALLHHAHALDRLEMQQTQGSQVQQLTPTRPQMTPTRPQLTPTQPQLTPTRPQLAPFRPPLHAPALHQPIMPQLPEQALSDAEDGVVVESDGHQEPAANDDGELTRYPDLQQVPQALYDPSHVHDPYNEAVIVEADPYFDGFRGVPARRGRPRHRAHGRAPKALDAELHSQDAVRENPSVRKKVDGPAVGVPDRKTFMVWHTVPVYVEVKTVQDDPADPQGKKSSHILPSPSFSQKAAFLKAQPPAAVHSFQVPPYASAAALQSQPLFISPHAPAPSLPAAPLSYSAKAAYFDAIPIAAVHDAQVHPLQAGSVMDHQRRPLFHENPANK